VGRIAMKSTGEVAVDFYPSAPRSQLAERVLGGAVLLAVAPLILALGAAVALASGRSPFVAHRRIGHLGRPFWMFKFRSMWDRQSRGKAPALVEYLRGPFVPDDKVKADPRVTHPLARWMRRFSLDELPQLLHVMRGEMSFVGPRPVTEDELKRYYGGVIPEVLSCRPGITGLWQVMGRSRLTYRQRRRLDLFWVRKANMALTLRVVARTIPAVLSGGNAA
jgi:exopolysaccharide production protein ExoY